MLFYDGVTDNIILKTIKKELKRELKRRLGKTGSHMGGQYGDGDTHVLIECFDFDIEQGILKFYFESVYDYDMVKSILYDIFMKYNLLDLKDINLTFDCREESARLDGYGFYYTHTILLKLDENFDYLWFYKSNGEDVELYLYKDILVNYDIFEDRTVRKCYIDGNYASYDDSSKTSIDINYEVKYNKLLSNNFSNINFNYNYFNRPFKSPMEVDLGASTVAVAKDIRNALKVICKDIKFSVRKSNYNKITIKSDNEIDEDSVNYIKRTISSFNHGSDLLNRYGRDLEIQFNF